MGIPVLSVALGNTRPLNVYNYGDNGVVDSIKVLIMHEHFIKPYSEELMLTRLLTR